MIRPAAIYVAIAFAAGFAFGVFREMAVRPRLGETAALLIEAPAMLAVSFFAARWIVARYMPASRLRDRIGMGVIALALLIGLEIAGSALLRGLDPGAWLAQLATVRGLITLALFAAFAALPAFAAASNVSKSKGQV